MDKGKFQEIKKMFDLIQTIINWVMILFIAVMTILTFSQVAQRVLLGSAWMWAEELTRYMFIWVIFLGLTNAIYHNDLTRFDMLKQKISKRVDRVLETVIYLVIILLLLMIFKGGTTSMLRQFSQMATSLPISMGLVYAVIPFSTILSSIYLLLKIVLLWTSNSDLNSREGR